MTLILGERAFAGCPRLRRIGVSDVGDPNILRVVAPGAISIGKDTFANTGAHTLLVSSQSTVTIGEDVGIPNIDLTIQGNIELNFNTYNKQVSRKVNTSGTILVVSDVINPGAAISLDLTSTGGSVILDSLRQVVSLTLGATPSVPQGKTLSGVFATAGTALTTLSLRSVYPIDLKNMLENTSNVKKVSLSVPIPSVIPPACFAGKTLIEDITVTGGITTIGEFAFTGCTALKKLQIGATADTVDVAVIERGAFYKCSQLTTVKLTDRLKEIGDVAFMDSGVSGEMIIPKNVSTHGASYFLRCNNLTKLTYLCNHVHFTDPTTINMETIQSLLELRSNTITFEINGDVAITPGDNVPIHIYTYNGTTTTVNDELFVKYYNPNTFTQRNNKYENIIDLLFSMQDTVNTINSILESNTYTPFKTNSSTKDKATEIADKLSLMLEYIEDYTSYIQEKAFNSYTCFYKTTTPKFRDELTTELDQMIVDISSNLSLANVPAIKDTIVSIMNSGITVPRNTIKDTLLGEIKTYNDTIYVNGDVSVNAPYYIVKEISSNNNIILSLPTNIITDYTGISTIVKEDGVTYMKYSSTELDNIVTVAGFELNDSTTYTVDGWIRYKMDDYYNKYEIDIISDMLLLFQTGSYDNKDINYEFSASKIINIINLKNYTGIHVSISSPAIIITEAAMEEMTDVVLSLQCSTLRIEDGAFMACQNMTLNITAEEIICGKNILAGSNLITINTNKELLNIPATPIILNNISVNYWDKNIEELLNIIKTETDIDTTTAYDVEYTTFTAIGSVNPIFAISFRTSNDLKEHTIIIPPSDYYWALSIGEVVHNVADFKMEKKNLVYYPDEAMRASRNIEWKNGIGRLGLNDDNYGLTNNFAPSSFEFKGYTFVQTEKSNVRQLRQVCTNNGEALSERRKNNILDTFFKILDIIGIVTMVIPVGKFSSIASIPIKLFFTSTKIGLKITSQVTRVGRLLIKAANIVTNRIKNSRVFLKVGNKDEYFNVAREIVQCGGRNACPLASVARNATKAVNDPMVSIINPLRTAAKQLRTNAKRFSIGTTDDLKPLAITYGNDAPTFAVLHDLPRTKSIRNVGEVPLTAKPITFVRRGTVNNITLGTKQTATKVIRSKDSISGITKITPIVKGGAPIARKRFIENLQIINKLTLKNRKDLLSTNIKQLELQARINEAVKTSIIQAARDANKHGMRLRDTVMEARNAKLAIEYKEVWIRGINTRTTTITRLKMFGIASAVLSVIIGTAVGVTKKKQGTRSTENIKSYIDTISTMFSSFSSTVTNTSTESDITQKKDALIANIVAQFTANTDIIASDATRLVTEIVNYTIASDDEKAAYKYTNSIMSILTEIINTTSTITSTGAVELLSMVSQLLTNNSLFETNLKSIEALAHDSDSIFGSAITEDGYSITGFNDYSIKHIAMYRLLNNLQYLGVSPTESETAGLTVMDPAAIHIPSNLSSLMLETPQYNTHPHVNPMPYRNSNIRTIADTYKDDLKHVTVGFNANTTVSYTINETWTDKFDVTIENPSSVEIVRHTLANVTLNNVKYMRIISPTINHWSGNIRSYAGPDTVEYCIEPSTWLALETYIGMGTPNQGDIYTDRDNKGQINNPYTTANPLLLNDNYMWNYTQLRTLDIADNGDFAALQVPYINTYDTYTGIGDPKHKSGLYMGWNSVKYEISAAEDSVVNVALGTSSDLVINYVNSTVTYIPAYAYSSSGITPVIDAGPFSVAGVTLPSTVTSIGKKAFYRSGLNYAIIPSNVRSIAQKAFAESGLTAVKFVDTASITMLSGSSAYIELDNPPITTLTYTDLYNAVSIRGNTMYSHGDVMILKPKLIRIGQMNYINPQFVLMLRATINNLEYSDGPGIIKVQPTIFDQLWVNKGGIKAEGYIISGDPPLLIIDSVRRGTLTLNSSSIITYSNIRDKQLFDESEQTYRATADVVIKNPVSLIIDGKTITNINELKLTIATIYIYKNTTPLLFNYEPIYVGEFNPPTLGDVYAWVYTISTNITTARSAPRAIEDSMDIGPNAFADNTTLETLVLPDTIRNIGDGAFAGCTALTTVELPPLKAIGDNVFADCTALTQVVFPPNIESIGGNVFDNCPALTTIKFDGVPPATIDPAFFTNITNLDNPITIVVPPQYAADLIEAIRESGVDLGSSSSNLTLAVNTDGIIPYFPSSIDPTLIRVSGTLFIYSSAAMASLKAGLAINPATKYVSWLAGGAAYDGMLLRTLGRKVYVYTPVTPTNRSPRIKYIFMNVQLLSASIVPAASDREPYTTGWICTFSADGIYPML